MSENKKEMELNLICNAHLDPVWQWEWEEGACAAISTFRCAAEFCREFGNFIFCHNEALLYQWIEEYEPSLFREIQELVKLGKWHIMGGWHLQPDCNMLSGEGFIRNILSGRRYFKEKFGVVPTTAINFDPFGHTRGLVQILAKSGYDSYLFCRPSENLCHLESDDFTWVGYDGSRVTASRAKGSYNSGMGHSTDKIDTLVSGQAAANKPFEYCLWGVGDHGGGASRADLRAIDARLGEWEKQGVKVIHSTPESYFEKLRSTGVTLPECADDLNAFAPGCYTSQVRIKQKYRQLENELFACEKMCTQLAQTTDFVYPADDFGSVLYDMLTVQFHDSLPGSSIQPVEEMAIRMIDHALEILSRLRARAFFKLSAEEKKAAEGEIPVIAYNPHPYPVTDVFACEFMLADQNWEHSFTIPEVYDANGKIPSQLEKEQSNIPLDWRKRIVFRATLPPMQISRFDCKLHIVPEKPKATMPENGTHYLFSSDRMQVSINKETGLPDSCVVDGTEYLTPGAFSIGVYADNEDPWGMTVDGWREKIGEFTLLSPEDGSRLSSLPEVIPSVRVIEDGEVRTVVEAVFGYESSRAVVHYLLSKSSPTVDLSFRVINLDTKKMYKLAVPTVFANMQAVGEVAFGEQILRKDGYENVSQKFIRLTDGIREMHVCNRGIYGSSLDGNTLLVSLMRSPSYTAHPIEGRRILPTDRHSPYIEQGERLFDLRVLFGPLPSSAAIAAQTYNETPTVLSFFPSGDGNGAPKNPLLTLDGNTVVLVALKQAEDKNGVIARLYNPLTLPVQTKLHSAAFDLCDIVKFSPYEVKTLRLSQGKIEECNMMEGLI